MAFMDHAEAETGAHCYQFVIVSFILSLPCAPSISCKFHVSWLMPMLKLGHQYLASSMAADADRTGGNWTTCWHNGSNDQLFGDNHIMISSMKILPMKAMTLNPCQGFSA